MLPEQFIIIGVLANLLGSLWYFKKIISGQTKPNLVSWFIWMLGPFLGVFFMLKAGAGFSFLGTLMAGITSFLVVVIALILKNSYWKINTFDIICGIIALISLMLYVFLHNLSISILFAIIADGLAYIPTIIKSWKFPETESSSTYIGGVINNIIALLIIQNWIFPIYSFSVAIVILNLAIIFSIYRKKIFRKKLA